MKTDDEMTKYLDKWTILKTVKSVEQAWTVLTILRHLGNDSFNELDFKAACILLRPLLLVE